MSKKNYKDKFKETEFLTDRIKDSKTHLIEELEDKAKVEKGKLINELKTITIEESEGMFLKHIPLNYVLS